MNEIVLYDYWRSSASYRVRIALNLLGLGWESRPVDLLRGAHRAPDHLARNPQGFVPVLMIDGHSMIQSVSIIEYLNETRQAGFLPDNPGQRARLRALAAVLATDTHPVCNLSVARRAAALAGEGKAAEAARDNWMHHFISRGLAAFETLLDHPDTGEFCHGGTPGLADICLIPQLYNADRYGVDYSGHDRISRIARNCAALPAFQSAAPTAPLG